MRLDDHQCRQILLVLTRFYGAGSLVWLFGSRTDDRARGGDVDLLVECASTRPIAGSVRRRHQAALAVEAVVGLSVDLLVRYQDDAESPFHALAKQQGILLGV